MQYMLMIHESEDAYSGEDAASVIEATIAGHMKLIEELEGAGVEYSGSRLREAHTATTLRHEGEGKTALHDGPFAETHEELGGFYIVEAPDLDAAIEWARLIPIPGKGAIEIRPVWPEDEM